MFGLFTSMSGLYYNLAATILTGVFNPVFTDFRNLWVWDCGYVFLDLNWSSRCCLDFVFPTVFTEEELNIAVGFALCLVDWSFIGWVEEVLFSKELIWLILTEILFNLEPGSLLFFVLNFGIVLFWFRTWTLRALSCSISFYFSFMDWMIS